MENDFLIGPMPGDEIQGALWVIGGGQSTWSI